MTSVNSRGVLAVLKAKEAREREKTKLQLAIDTDVQKLKSKAEKLLETVPDDEEYYTIIMEGEEIEYENPGVVIDTFCKFWESEGFIVPKVKAKKARGNKKFFSYTIRFRPTDEAIRLARMVEDHSSGSSNVS